MGISSSGLISGINADELVSGLINLERQPITILQNRQKDYELKIASVLDMNTKLSSFKSALSALNSSSKFNTKTASVTKTSDGAELLTVSASSTATAGSYSIQVNQLAAANKKASNGQVDENTTAIASASGSFKFKVGSGGSVTTVSVNSSITLQGLRDDINSANAGVTASILNDGTGSNPYRLVLTADDAGSSNTIYITQNDTNLDFTNKKIEDAYAYTTNGYGGTVTSNSGTNSSTYASTTNKTYLVEIVTGGASGTATYKYSTDGGITFKGYDGSTFSSTAGTDTSGGAISTTVDYTNEYIDGTNSDSADSEGVKIQFSAGSDLVAGDRFTVDVFNPEMQAAQDAVIEVDNATITKSTNTIDDAIQGVTLNLLKADTSSTVTLTVSSDTSSAKSSVKSFVDSYNTLIKAINDQLTYNSSTKKKNPLLGDPTLLEIRKKIGDIIHGVIPGLSSSDYTNLSQIGISSDGKTGKLSLNETTLGSALSSNPDAVAKLFIGTGTASNSAITFVSKTSKTQSGTHNISVTTAPEKATLLGNETIASGGITAAETLTFLYSSNKTESSPDYTGFSVAFSANATISTIVNNLNSAFATNDVGLSASNESGKVRITSTDYGADIYFKVTSSTGDVAGQIGFKSSVAGSDDDEGVDIVGTMNNRRATGTGNTLTGVTGFPEEGLKISTESNQTGGFGTVKISSGVADKLPSILDSYTNSSTGILKSKEQSIQKTVDNVKAQQERIEKRLITKEQRLREQFARLEVLLGKLNVQSQYITNQLAQITGIKK
ncbi:MAG TPA: hypothetical protein DHV16_01050 [Nitrospiraceae bacterium]|nr:MAG: hypothetical protein A2Z82_05255 [Nitrospirae bacterium GWA2_46_11]HAK87956.1 hypothetical protein [Nitrospiraceae bacterium]HCZ10852.1 hypothetical protein [Nitrospiraceae bacterium]